MGRNRKRNRNRQRWWNFLAEWSNYGLDLTEDADVSETDSRLPAHYQGQAATTPPRGWWERMHAKAIADKTKEPAGFKAGAIATHTEGGWSIPKEDQRPEMKSCGFAKMANVQFSTELYYKIKQLMEEFTAHEWLAYLQADENGVFVDLVIPEQVGKPSTVTVTAPPSADVRIDGVIHSHHSMKAFHSGTDDTHLVRNHPVSIVVARENRKLVFEAVRTMNLPCGGWFQSKVDVDILLPDRQEWLASVLERIKKVDYTPPVVVSGYGSYTPPVSTTPSGGREVTTPSKGVWRSQVGKDKDDKDDDKELPDWVRWLGYSG